MYVRTCTIFVHLRYPKYNFEITKYTSFFHRLVCQRNVPFSSSAFCFRGRKLNTNLERAIQEAMDELERQTAAEQTQQALQESIALTSHKKKRR